VGGGANFLLGHPGVKLTKSYTQRYTCYSHALNSQSRV